MADTSRPRMSPGLRLLLVLSLGLNLLILGAVVGLALRGGPPRGPRSVEFTLGPIARALSEEDRHALADRLRTDPAMRPPGHESWRTDGTAMLAALRADPFEPEDLLSLLSQQQDRARQAFDAGKAVLVERIAAMAPAERAAFADRLEQEIARRRGPGGED